MISNKLKEKIALLMSSKNSKPEGIVSLIELNKYDDMLEKIYLHLKADLGTYGLKKTEHKEMFGTADYKYDLGNKIKKVQEYLDLAYLILNLRSMNTSIIDFLGGNNGLVEYRNNEVREEIKSLNHVIKKICENIIKEVKGLKSIINDAQSFVKSNKSKIVVGVSVLAVPLVAPLGVGSLVLGGIIGQTVVASTVTAKKVFGDDEKVDLLENRKQEMLLKLKGCLDLSELKSDDSIKLVKTNLHKLIESEKPITLAFQKIDDTHILCLNTNEKILVSA